MVGDRLIEAIRSVVYRVLNDQDHAVDFRALYPGKVASQTGNEVDLFLDDARIGSKVGVPIASWPGTQLVLAIGTRVLLGWLNGDERFPRAFPAWDGAGSLTSLTLTAGPNPGGATVTVTALGAINIVAAPGQDITLNGGTQAIARHGDAVTATGTDSNGDTVTVTGTISGACAPHVKA